MELRIYADRCLTCQDNDRLDVIHFVAKQHGLKVNMRRVYVFPELEKEVVSADPMPFIELNGNTLDFYSIGKNLLKEETLHTFIEKNKE